MTDLKPMIFIGSSGAGYAIAEKVKNCLADSGNPFLWKERGVWEDNVSTFDNLLRMSNYFDFGVFVATADDATLTKDQIVIEPRDNVILEMALFLGSIGRHKSFLLVEDGVKLPSDFNGIFQRRFNRNDANSIADACKEYSQKIQEHYALGHLSMYPTTALAIGYYKNFIAGLVEGIQYAEAMNFDGVEYTDFKVRVVLPSDLRGAVRERAHQFYKRHNLVEQAIVTKFRKHPAWFQLDPKQAPTAIMYDMPSTLTGIDDAIEMILRKDYQGRTRMQDVIEQRELNNFRRVLQIQLDRSPFAKATVEILDEF